MVDPTQTRIRTRRIARVALAVGLVVAVVIAVIAVIRLQSEPAAGGTAYPGVEYENDVEYGADPAARLDVCSPANGQPGSGAARPAILSIHGGGWRTGDKAGGPWRDSCGWLAAEGFVVFQMNYRLAPQHPYPAAIDDVEAALAWITGEEQVDGYDIDPTRLGALGDSAGGNLAALLATRDPSSVAAVAIVSAPVDLTEASLSLGALGDGFDRVQLDYLGCGSYLDCPDARAASPLYSVGPGDPPFFIVHAVGDPLIPVEQADAMHDALAAAAVDVNYRRVSGTEHALPVLDEELRVELADWFETQLD